MKDQMRPLADTLQEDDSGRVQTPGDLNVDNERDRNIGEILTDTNNNIQKQGLLSHTWTREEQRDLPACPYSLRAFGGRLYSCHSNGITLYNLHLQPSCSIFSGDMGSVYDVATVTGVSQVSTDNSDVTTLVVAASSGLFHINHQGEKLHSVDTGDFRSVQIQGGLLYASEYKTGTIRVYDPTQNWHKHPSIAHPCQHEGDHWITLCSCDDRLHSSCLCDHRVHSWSLDGKLLTTWGGRGPEAGRFSYPLLCDTADPHTLLVADKNNHRLQAVRATAPATDQTCDQVINLKSPVKYPRAATCFQNKLVVVSVNPCALTVFT